MIKGVFTKEKAPEVSDGSQKTHEEWINSNIILKIKDNMPTILSNERDTVEYQKPACEFCGRVHT